MQMSQLGLWRCEW